LASMKTLIPISGFDADLLDPPLHVRFARTDEAFVGIAMTQPIMLKDNALVLTDEKRILCIYPYRDSDYSRIALQTRNALIIAYGAPGITETQLRVAVETTLSYVKQTSQGDAKMVKVFSATCNET
jgi:DNA/RNA-binding domain of Phe-tRNA-synthetase-like protein